MKKQLLALSLISSAILGCSEDFDIAGPYQEKTSIYGLLNADTSEHVQYIRIGKAFLGEGNVYLMAQQQDSISYPDILDVTMERIVNDNVVSSFPLVRLDTVPKDSGTFAYPGQVVYAYPHDIVDPVNSSYRIKVKNRETGNEVSSVTKVIPPIEVNVPSRADADFATQLPITYKFDATDFAYAFGLDIIFRYSEINSSGSIEYKSATIGFPLRLLVPGQTTPISFPFYRPDFYALVGPVIHNQAGTGVVQRRIDNLPPGQKPVEYRFYCATEDLYTYYQLTRPSDGIVQERPLFTTVKNGVGLFTSRLTHSEWRNMTVATKAAFDTSAYTSDLLFNFR